MEKAQENHIKIKASFSGKGKGTLSDCGLRKESPVGPGQPVGELGS